MEEEKLEEERRLEGGVGGEDCTVLFGDRLYGDWMEAVELVLWTYRSSNL